MSNSGFTFVGYRFTVSTETQLITFQGPVLATVDAFYLAGCTTGIGAVLSGLGNGVGAAGGVVGAVAGAVIGEVAVALAARQARGNISIYWRRGSDLPPEILRRMKLRNSTEVFVVPRAEVEDLRYWLLWGEMKIFTETTDFRIDVNPFKLLWMRRTIRKLGWGV